jgi:SAM-dependent methyltransferase
MISDVASVTPSSEARARLSRGTSGEAIYRLVGRALKERYSGGGVLLDVGCGRGDLWSYIGDRFDRYVGVDAARYDGFPADGEFLKADLEDYRVPLPDGVADVVVAVETIEHLENPRAFCRELVRLAKPGGWVVVTTPNQLSLLSKLTLLTKNQFNAFQETPGLYPAHLTALLECDLRRIATECHLELLSVDHTRSGRIPGTRWRWPRILARFLPRSFSDNVLLIGKVTGD